MRMARRAYFSAAHKLYDAHLTLEENIALYGPQAASHGLGHNYILEVYLEGRPDAKSGMIMPIAQVDSILKEVVAGLDHKFLNIDVPYFKERVPTTENLAQYCYEKLQFILTNTKSAAMYSAHLQKVRLFETEDLWVDYGLNIASEF